MTGLVRKFLLRRNMSSRHIVILNKTKQCRKECPFLFESPRSPFPSGGLWTAFSSLGTLDFLSTYLGTDSLRSVLIHLQVFGDFPSSFLLLISNLISLWFKSMLCIISFLLNFSTCGL